MTYGIWYVLNLGCIICFSVLSVPSKIPSIVFDPGSWWDWIDRAALATRASSDLLSPTVVASTNPYPKIISHYLAQA